MNVLVEEFNQSHPGMVDFLAIPTNNFGLQEPGSNAEIPLGLEHVRPGNGFKALYKLAEKNSANGADADPLFVFLKENCEGPQRVLGDPGSFYFTPIANDDITWNFEKFLIDQNGVPYKRYTPDEYPLAEMRQDILTLLSNAESETEVEDVEQPEVEEEQAPAEEPAENQRAASSQAQTHENATPKKHVPLFRSRTPHHVRLGSLLGKGPRRRVP